MNCPNCGAEVPAGSVMCPVCGGPVVAQPGLDYGAAPTQPQYMDLAPRKKQSALPGILIALVAVVAVVLVGYFLLGGRYVGKYKLVEMTYEEDGYSETVTSDDLEMSGMNVSLNVGIRTCKFKGLGQDNAKYKISIKGEDVTVTASDGTIHGSYDKENKRITLPFDGALFGMRGVTLTLVFEK